MTLRVLGGFSIDEDTLARIGRAIADKAYEIDPVLAGDPNYELIANAAKVIAMKIVVCFLEDLRLDPGVTEAYARHLLRQLGAGADEKEDSHVQSLRPPH
jgi:hypothetical protein